MKSLEILTVTYAPDLALFEDLHHSVQDFTGDPVTQCVVVDDEDLAAFERFRSERCRVLSVSEVLPRYFRKIPNRSLMVNLKRPWPPVRGWVFQQLVKLAMAARSEADLVLLMDSDVALVRAVDSGTFFEDGCPHFFRLSGGVHPGMSRHVQWHAAARRMLGLDPTTGPPLNDYVDSFNVWSPTIVRAMTDRIRSVSASRSWETEFASQLHVSEFILYGVFVDEVLGQTADVAVVDRMRCHNYWDETPLSREAAFDFADSTGPDDLAIMISAKSRTELDVRHAAWLRARTATS